MYWLAPKTLAGGFAPGTPKTMMLSWISGLKAFFCSGARGAPYTRRSAPGYERPETTGRMSGEGLPSPTPPPRRPVWKKRRGGAFFLTRR